MSGHPVEFSPAELTGPISTMECLDWDDPKHQYTECRVAELNELAEAFKNCVKQWITIIGELAKTYVESSVPSSQSLCYEDARTCMVGPRTDDK